jgi:ABC-2 type transport system permease protein
MRHGNLDGVVALPGTLDAALHGGQANVSVTYDPARQAMAGIVQSLVAQVADRVDRRLTGRHQVLFVRVAPLGGRVLDQFAYTLPGIVALTLVQVGLFATTMPLIQLRQSGVLRQLGATPLRRGVLAAGQIAVRVTLALVQVVLLVLLGHFALGVAIVGSWLALALVAMLGALVMIALGYLLAARARTGESGNGLVTVVFMPLVFLSGLFFPLELAPAWMKQVAVVVPSTFLGDALRQVMVGATPEFSQAVDLAALAGFLVVLSAAAVRLFRWE